MRKVLIAAAAILLLAGGALFAVYWLSRDPASSDGDTAPPAPVEVPATSLPSQALADIGRLGVPRQVGPPLAPPIAYGPPPVRAPAGTWESIPPARRLSGPVGQAVARGLAELQPTLSGCFDEVTQARYGQQKIAETAAEFASLEDGGAGTPTVLMLQIETLQDAVRIVEAPLEARGDASDGLVACAQAALRGRTFPAPGVAPGIRQRLLHALQQ